LPAGLLVLPARRPVLPVRLLVLLSVRLPLHHSALLRPLLPRLLLLQPSLRPAPSGVDSHHAVPSPAS
jgi:hypothetical protein